MNFFVSIQQVPGIIEYLILYDSYQVIPMVFQYDII